jgi:predicted nucleic acid-binding protein
MTNVGKILLLCIGINEYNNLPQNQLKYSVNDANLLYKGYSKYSCEYKELLTDSNATKENIQKCMEDISSKSRDNDYLILSFAGHGFAKTNIAEIDAKNCFICPNNFDPNHVDITGISLFELNNRIKNIKSKNKLLILDACHSGGALRRSIEQFNLRDIKSQEFLDLVVSGSGNGIVTACDSNELALEDDDLQQGIFTHVFNEVLGKTEKDYLKFNETFEKISKKVKKLTNNKQHPKSKCDGKDFVIPCIPKDIKTSKGVRLDLSILPVQKEEKIDKIDEFEDKIIFLLQNNRNIELEKTLQNSINEAYIEIGKIISPPHNNEKEHVISLYKSCRSQIEPIKIILDYAIKNDNESIINNNINSIFRLGELSYRMGGVSAIVDIPHTLIAEIIFKYIGKAYKMKFSKVLQTTLNYVSPKYGEGIPFIYKSKTWHPEIFHRNVVDFFNFIYPKESYIDNIVLKQEIRNLCEIIFIIDSYSKLNRKYHSFPIYYYLDDNAPLIILRNISNKKFMDFITEILNLNKNKFIDIIVERQELLNPKSEPKFEIWDSYNLKEEFNKLKD